MTVCMTFPCEVYTLIFDIDWTCSVIAVIRI